MATTNFASEQFLYLTTRGRKTGLSREIEIWFTQKGDKFYIIGEYATSHWIRNLQENPEAQVRVADQRLTARARILSRDTEAKLVQTIQELSRKKYGWGEGLVVELTPVLG